MVGTAASYVPFKNGRVKRQRGDRMDAWKPEHIVPGRKKFSYCVPKILCISFNIFGLYLTK